jgi:hypothetical protein
MWATPDELREDDEWGILCQSCIEGLCIECHMVARIEGIPLCDLCARKDGLHRFAELIGDVVSIELGDFEVPGELVGLQADFGEISIVIEDDEGDIADFPLDGVLALHHLTANETDQV